MRLWYIIIKNDARNIKYILHRIRLAIICSVFIDYYTCNCLPVTNIYICFYRHIYNIMHLKNLYISKPNQTKPVKITKNQNINDYTYIYMLYSVFY